MNSCLTLNLMPMGLGDPNPTKNRACVHTSRLSGRYDMSTESREKLQA